MSALSLVLALSACLIQSASGPMDSVLKSDNPPFTRDFLKIESLGQAKDSVGLENMVAELKARWKDADMDCYCRLMDRLLGCLRTDFDPVDYGKLKALSNDVLSDLDKKLEQGMDPVLVPHYYQFQLGYISVTYRAKYTVYTTKGDIEDEVWVNQRKDVITRLLKVWKLTQEGKDPAWSMDIVPPANVMPPTGTVRISGMSPDSIQDPDLRAKYEADIKANNEKKRWWRAQRRLRQTEDQLKKRLMNDIKVMYNTPPLAPDELKSLLDTYVKDEEQKEMFLEASQE